MVTLEKTKSQIIFESIAKRRKKESDNISAKLKQEKMALERRAQEMKREVDELIVLAEKNIRELVKDSKSFRNLIEGQFRKQYEGFLGKDKIKREIFVPRFAFPLGGHWWDYSVALDEQLRVSIMHSGMPYEKYDPNPFTCGINNKEKPWLALEELYDLIVKRLQIFCDPRETCEFMSKIDWKNVDYCDSVAGARYIYHEFFVGGFGLV